MKIGQYLETKVSGIHYPDVVPVTWKLNRLGDVISFAQGKAHEPYINDDGEYICVNSRFVSTQGKSIKKCSINLTPANVGDILMVMSDLPNGRALAKGYYVTENLGLAVNQRVCRITAIQADSKYLYYMLDRHPMLMMNDDGVNQTHLSNDDFKKLKLYLPSREEQIQIARFLDHETARIDALIAEQQRLIELLKEKRQAVISRAVTKGLNPNAPMKDSGVEWLGQVPEHWVVAPVKFFFEFLDGRRIPLKAEDRGAMQGEYPYYGASGIIDYVNDFIFDEDLVLVSEDGANLLMRSTPIAFVAQGKYWVNNHAHIVRPQDENLVYWAEVIEQQDLTNFVTGSAQPKLTAEALGSIKIAVPPTSYERAEIQKIILGIDERLGKLLSEATCGVRLLQERRSALISAAVTGKIDVRNR